jgi:hypothetical protein
MQLAHLQGINKMVLVIAITTVHLKETIPTYFQVLQLRLIKTQ